MKTLGSGRVGGVVEHEAHDAVCQRLGRTSPETMQGALRLCGQQVEHIQSEHNEIVQQSQYLVFRQGDEVCLCQRLYRSREVRMGPKEGLGLYQPGAVQLF